MALAELDPLALAAGTRIDQYEVITRLGLGGMGAVYLVAWEGSRFALKLSRERFSDLSEHDRQRLEARMKREVSTLAALEHPNIVKVHGFSRWPGRDGYIYIVQDFVDGS